MFLICWDSISASECLWERHRDTIYVWIQKIRLPFPILTSLPAEADCIECPKWGFPRVLRQILSQMARPPVWYSGGILHSNFYCLDLHTNSSNNSLCYFVGGRLNLSTVYHSYPNPFSLPTAIMIGLMTPKSTSILHETDVLFPFNDYRDITLQTRLSYG